MKDVEDSLWDCDVSGERASSMERATGGRPEINTMATTMINDNSPLLPTGGNMMFQSAQPLKQGGKATFKRERTPLASTQVSGGGDVTKIHSLYQDLYLTDLKNDLGEVEGDLSKEKEKNLQLTQVLAKYKKELQGARRTIANYRKIVTEMQKNFFSSKQGTGPLTAMTMTSLGGRSGVRRDPSNLDDHEVLSTTSADPTRAAVGEAKVRNYLDLNDARASKSSGSGHGGLKVRGGGGTGTDGAPIVKVNYNNACDLDRLEKFKGLIHDLAQTKKLARVIGLIFTGMQDVLPGQQPSVFVFQANLLENAKGKIKLGEDLLLQRTVLDGRGLDVIGQRSQPMSDPLFKRSKDAARPMRTNEYISVPIFGLEGGLCLNVQVLAKRKRNSKFSAGFTMTDELLLQLFCKIIEIKLHQTLARIAQSRTQKDVV